MKESGLRRIGAVVVICALVGALAGIAGSAAAPSKSTATQPKKAKAQKKAAKKALRRGGLRGPGFFGGPRGLDGGPVHSEAVVPNADGTGFDTITADGGTLTSVDGSTVHIKEGTDKATYKADVAIDVGSSPTVIRNGKKATLGDLKDGDHVQVIQGTPKGTLVMAADDAWIAQREKDHMGFGRGHGHGGPPPPGGHAGPPPPGDPAAPGDPGDNQNGSQSSGSSSDGSNS
jgi:hypothetical protein